MQGFTFVAVALLDRGVAQKLKIAITIFMVLFCDDGGHDDMSHCPFVIVCRYRVTQGCERGLVV